MQKIALAVALLCGALTLNAQKLFQGTVSYDFAIEGPNTEMVAFMMPEKMIVAYGKKGMKTYFQGGMMADLMGQIVINGKTKQTFQVKESEQTVYLMGPEDMATAEDNTPDQVTKELEVIEIQGYLCQKYKTVKQAEEGETVQYVWTTQALKAPDLGESGLTSMGGMAMTGGNKVPGFPMKVVSYDPSADITVTLVVSELDFTKLDKKAFDIPKGYAIEEFVAEEE